MQRANRHSCQYPTIQYTICKKIDMYLICDTIGLSILRFGKCILRYTIRTLRYAICYDLLTWIINGFHTHSNEPFELNVEYKF